MRLKPILFFLVVGLIAGSFIYREASRTDAVDIGAQAPDFQLKDESGREVKLSDYRGKLVFLNFWTTWCVPCVDEMPEMELMHKRFKARNFQMLGISLDTNWKVVKEFYKQHNLTLPTLLDPGRQVATRYKVFKQPETFLIDANGSILKHYVGPIRWANPRVLASIEAMIPLQEQVSAK